jgi:hypothetical protein
VAIHFSRLLRHAWVTVELFLFPGHHTGNMKYRFHYLTYDCYMISASPPFNVPFLDNYQYYVLV